MFKKSSIINALLGAALVLTAQSAAATVMTVCPTPDMLKHFGKDRLEINPIAFDQQNAQMILSVKQQNFFKADDKIFGGYERLFFITSGLIEIPGVSTEKLMNDALEKMRLDSDTPFMYRVYKDIVLPTCSYTVPGEAIKAVVYQAPEFKPRIKVTV